MKRTHHKDLQSALDEYASMFDTRKPESISAVTACCPHCGVYSSYKEVNRANITAKIASLALHHVGVNRILFQASCYSCNGLIAIASGFEAKSADITTQQLVMKLLWPKSTRPSLAPQSLPTSIKKSYDEARLVLSDSPQAAAVLARRCLQHVIRDKLSITEKTLFKEIERACQRTELSAPTRDALDHVRQIGNLGAHPEVDQASTIIEVDREDAEYTIDVLELLFQDLYLTPERTRAMKQKLDSR